MVQRYTHGNKEELTRLLKEEGLLTPRIIKPIDKVTSSCIPCSPSGRPKNSKKLSLKHVNKDFNIEVQADFMTVKHEAKTYELLNITYLGTGYGEKCVVTSRPAAVMMSKFEETWICRHGSPTHFSADPEFIRTSSTNTGIGSTSK